MPKAATTPAPHGRHKALADSTTTATPETTRRDDGRDLTCEAEPCLRSPQQFYAELTKRPDVQAFLKRLANR